MKFLMATCGGADLPKLAPAMERQNALAGLYVSVKKPDGVPATKFHRAWIFHLAMKPFYQLTSPGFIEQAHYRMFPLWRAWMRCQNPLPFDVAYGVLSYASEAFEIAERRGALKVIDASSSHPTTAFGYWQRECDLWSPGAKVPIPRWLFARTNRELDRADLILCRSVFVRDTMIANGIPASKCALNPYGVDTSVFTQRPAVPEKPTFVSVGAICLRKGHQYLFRAFEKVRQVLTNAELICAGVYLPDFKKERPRWEGTFTHYPHLPHAELAKVLQRATAFVFPSNEEGFARALIEGLAVGLPIITTYESGATTVMQDGVQGFIVRTRDVNQLAESMIRVATDRSLNERMGKAAQAAGAQANSWDDCAKRLIKTCQEALDQRGRHSSVA
jgi:glycosyltransferase involved in cell wall biosynthesis